MRELFERFRNQMGNRQSANTGQQGALSQMLAQRFGGGGFPQGGQQPGIPQRGMMGQGGMPPQQGMPQGRSPMEQFRHTFMPQQQQQRPQRPALGTPLMRPQQQSPMGGMQGNSQLMAILQMLMQQRQGGQQAGMGQGGLPPQMDGLQNFLGGLGNAS